jgi:short-subunit dehydrogenase
MKKVLITGASSGIGSVFAKELARQGYDVTCVARNEEKLYDLTKELDGSHRYIRANLTDADDLAAICQEISDSKYTLLVNNAGYGIYDHFENTPLEKIHHLIRLNVSALVDLSYVFLKSASSGDALINVSSTLSLLPYPGGAVYSATKAFVTNFTEALWYEYKDKGIYVMALLPGVMDTNFHHIAMGQKDYKAPSGPSYPPEVVVKEALATLQKRKSSTLISGSKYRFLTALATRLMSRTQMISMMGKGSAGL